LPFLFLSEYAEAPDLPFISRLPGGILIATPSMGNELRVSYVNCPLGGARRSEAKAAGIHRSSAIQQRGGEMKTKTEDELARKGWEPSALTGEEAVKTEERSLDIGESGQFAPSGYYNQQKANEPKRTLDDDILPPARTLYER
jgi:hypothetical protein